MIVKELIDLAVKLDRDVNSPEWIEHLKEIDVFVKKYIKSHESSLDFTDFKVSDVSTPKNIVILACEMSGVKSKKVINRYLNKYQNDIDKILRMSEVGQPSSEDLFYVVPLIVATVVICITAVEEGVITADKNYTSALFFRLYMRLGWIEFNEKAKKKKKD